MELVRTAAGYQARLRYESTHVVTPDAPSAAEALQHMIQLLLEQGYTQLRSQQSYRDGLYLGSQELWVEYPDRQPEPEVGLLGLMKKWLERSSG